MKNTTHIKRILNIALIAAMLFGGKIAAQSAPGCPTNLIYGQSGNIINGYTQVNGTPTVQANNMPAGSGGLAVGPAS